jgi:hypothetical protein
MDVLYEVATIVVAVIVIATLSIKLYLVGVTADKSLPKNSTEAQKILTAVQAIVEYLIDNQVIDQQLLSELETIISALTALGVNVAPLRNTITNYSLVIQKKNI